MRLRLVAVPALALALAAGPSYAAPTTVSANDPAGDQTRHERWDDFPALQRASDLRAVTVKVANGTLTGTFTFAKHPTSGAAQQVAEVVGSLKNGSVNISAWRNNRGGSGVDVTQYSATGSRTFCAGQGTVAVRPAQQQVVLTVPVACLPAGKFLRTAVASTGLDVLDSEGQVAGGVASDSADLIPLQLR